MTRNAPRQTSQVSMVVISELSEGDIISIDLRHSQAINKVELLFFNVGFGLSQRQSDVQHSPAGFCEIRDPS